MLLKEYINKRIQIDKYYILIDTIRNLYGDALDDMLVYFQDIPNQPYKNGRLLLIFCKTSMIKVNFTESTIKITPVKYKDINCSFFRKDGLGDYQPGELILTLTNEEIVLNPIKDFSYEVGEKVDLIIKIFKFISED